MAPNRGSQLYGIPNQGKGGVEKYASEPRQLTRRDFQVARLWVSKTYYIPWVAFTVVVETKHGILLSPQKGGTIRALPFRPNVRYCGASDIKYSSEHK